MKENVNAIERERKRDANETRIKREEREKKRKLNEELKMKRMQERSDKQKKKTEKTSRKCKHIKKTSEDPQMRLNSSRNVPIEQYYQAVKRGSGQLVPVRVGLNVHFITTRCTFLVSERHTFNILRDTMIAMTMTLSSFVGANSLLSFR